MKMKRIAFVLYKFSTGKKKIELVLPETWQAAALFDQLQKNLAEFSKWLVWANKIDSVQKEIDSIMRGASSMIKLVIS